VKRIAAGTASIKTAHVRYAIDMGRNAVVITGAGKFHAGVVSDMSLTDPINSTGTLHLLIVGSEIYVQLPPSLNQYGKPWVLATPQSTDPLISGISSIASAKDATSIATIRREVEAGRSARDDGADGVNGMAATKYTVVIDVRKLPATTDNQPLIDSRLKTISMDIWLDGQGRILRDHEAYRVHGQDIDIDITYSMLNEPVTIAVPPSDQVATS